MTKITALENFNRINGTSFHGYTILASANDIRSKLDVDVACYGGDKTNFEFDLELEDGTPFTLYDWKEGDWVDEDTRLYYHIGTHTEEDSQRALQALKEHGLKCFTPAYAENMVEQMKKMLGF